MKKIISLIWIILLSVSAMAQNKGMEQLFQKYSGKDGFTSIVITKNMFQLFANIDDAENDDFIKTVKNLDFIKILTAENLGSNQFLYGEVLQQLPEKDYKELMVIKESGQEVKFMTAEKDGVIRDLIMISKEGDGTTVIWMSGIIDMKTVAKIARSMDIEGMDELEKADQK